MDQQESIVPAWEFFLLLLLMVTVFSLSSSTPVQSFPERDPYDIMPEIKVTDARTLVEIGR